MAQIVWNDDFSCARNTSIDMATGDWILVLDADNYLRTESRPGLLQSLRNSDMLSYQLMVRDYFDDGHCETSFCTRLFRRMSAIRYVGIVHEQVTTPLLEIMKSNPKWRNAILKDVIIEHDGYMQQKRQDKRSRNIRLLTRALEDAPSDIYRRFKLAQELGAETDIGYHHLSIALDELLHLSDQKIQEYAFAHELMANAALRLAGRTEPEKALRICDIAESLFSRHPVLSFVRALSYYLSRDIDNSLSSANEALAIVAPPGNFVCNPDWLREDVYILISRIRQDRGSILLTVDTLRHAVAEFPNSQRLVHALIRSALAARVPLVALDAGAKWMKSNGLDVECLLLCADAAEMHGDPSIAARWRSQAGRSGG